jgi:transcriptional regulator with XRE-family HTH domain
MLLRNTQHQNIDLTMTQPESWRNVGNRIRHLRKANRLTLRQLSRGCDLSANTISLVERGEVAPSIETLCKIATALGVSPGSLFLEVCTPQVVLQRATGGSPETGISEKTLQAVVCGPAFSTVDLASIELDGLAIFTKENSSLGRMSILCLSGQIELEVDGQSYCLKPGDNLTLNSNAFHRLRNPGSITGTAVLVLPPGTPLQSPTGD